MVRFLKLFWEGSMGTWEAGSFGMDWSAGMWTVNMI